MCGGKKGTSIFEQEQMGKQMREPPGYQLSSAMHLGNDATFSPSAVCCLGGLIAQPPGLKFPFSLQNSVQRGYNHGISNHCFARVTTWSMCLVVNGSLIHGRRSVCVLHAFISRVIPTFNAFIAS